MSFAYSTESNKLMLTFGVCSALILVGEDHPLPLAYTQTQNQRIDADEMAFIVAHTDRALTMEQRVVALDRISRTTQQESVPLGFDPDDYPLS